MSVGESNNASTSANDDDWSIASAMFIVQVSIGLCILSREGLVQLVKSIRRFCTGHRRSQEDDVAELNNIMRDKCNKGIRKRLSRRRTFTTPSPSDESSKRSAEGDEEKGGSERGEMDFYALTQLVSTEARDRLVSRDIPHTPRIENAVVVAFRRSLLQSVFVGHVRRESNFILSNVNPSLKIPPRYPPERAHYSICFQTLFSILTNSIPVIDAIWNSFGIALISSGFSALVWYAHVKGNHASQLVYIVEGSVRNVLLCFRFFPAFLLLGLISFIVDRWRGFLLNCHQVQARLHDVGVCIGSSVKNPENLNTRRKLFRLYRYLNVVHAQTYASVCTLLPQKPQSFVAYGLLTDEEGSLIEPMENKGRDTVVTWIGIVIEEMIKENMIRELAVTNSLTLGVRAATGKHHDLFVRNMPNIWFGLCSCIVNYLVVLQTIHAIIQLDSKSIRAINSVDERRSALYVYSACVLIFSFLMASTYWVAEKMIDMLIMPFHDGDDAYNVDALLASTDRTLFATLRASFDKDILDKGIKRVFYRNVWRGTFRRVQKKATVSNSFRNTFRRK